MDVVDGNVDVVATLVTTTVVVAFDGTLGATTEDVPSSLLEPHATTNEIPSRLVINVSRFDIPKCLAPISRIIHGGLFEIWI